jgi:hypothetical protein
VRPHVRVLERPKPGTAGTLSPVGVRGSVTRAQCFFGRDASNVLGAGGAAGPDRRGAPKRLGLLRLRSDSRLLNDVPISRVAVRRAAGPVSREAPLARTSWFRGFCVSSSRFVGVAPMGFSRGGSLGVDSSFPPSSTPLGVAKLPRPHVPGFPGASAFSAAADAQGLRGLTAKVGFRLRSGRVCSSSSPVTYVRGRVYEL